MTRQVLIFIALILALVAFGIGLTIWGELMVVVPAALFGVGVMLFILWEIAKDINRKLR